VTIFYFMSRFGGCQRAVTIFYSCFRPKVASQPLSTVLSGGCCRIASATLVSTVELQPGRRIGAQGISHKAANKVLKNCRSQMLDEQGRL